MTAPNNKPAGLPLPSNTRGIHQALSQSEPLAQLTRRLRDSQARMVAIAPLLPLAMRPFVKAGPIDETGWTLLAANNAVSAKLRQMLPALEAHLRVKGWDGPPVRVRLFTPA